MLQFHQRASHETACGHAKKVVPGIKYFYWVQPAYLPFRGTICMKGKDSLSSYISESYIVKLVKFSLLPLDRYLFL